MICTNCFSLLNVSWLRKAITFTVTDMLACLKGILTNEDFICVIVDCSHCLLVQGRCDRRVY